MNLRQSKGDSFVTIQANPEQARRLLELGAISESQARHAEEAGGLLVRIPTSLLEEYKAHETLSVPYAGDIPGVLQAVKAPGGDEAELEKMAQWLHNSGLNTAARLFLASNRPLSFVGSQLFLAVQPIARLAFGLNNPTGRWSSLLENRANLDRLIDRLVALDRSNGKDR
jgi:hypothetical protein